MWLADAAAISTPVWPYIVGGIAAVMTVIFSSHRMISSWKESVEKEAQEKYNNTSAIRANTEAVRELTVKIDSVIDTQQNHEQRITALEIQRGQVSDRREVR